MQAYTSTPDGPTSVTLEEVEEPRPAPGEAVIAVAASSLNRGELALLSILPAGWRPGWDVAGTIAVPAADGSGPPAGTRVVAFAQLGGWSERVAVATDRIAALPDAVGFTAAATLPVAAATALRTLRYGGDLLGRPVLVTGAGGGVGRFQVQLAALAGARVTAVASERHAARLGELGATSVVPRTADAPGDFVLVTDAVGGENLEASIGQVAPEGTVVMFGMSVPDPGAVGLGMFRGGHENARLQAFNLTAEVAGIGADLAILAGLVAEGRLAVDVGVEHEWTELPAGLDALRRRAVAGKVVVRVAA